MSERKGEMQKLDPEHRHILKLVEKDADGDGWAPVSEQLFPILSNNIPLQLVEFEKESDGGRARLTEKGRHVVEAMDWL